MTPRNPFQLITLSVLVLPPILLAAYFLAAFPQSPLPSIAVHDSLASLPADCQSHEIYPEDFYEGGAYVTLPYGRVRYWLIGPPKGKKVVLIHGLSIPALVWKDVVPKLASRGFRVLVYDLYGRGYSDAPQTTYDTALYTTQLALLMQHIKWDSAHIVGLSMGGAIAGAFAAQFPQLAGDRIVLVASAGLMETSELPRTAKVMSSPIVQFAASSFVFRRYLEYLANPASSKDPGVLEVDGKPKEVDPVLEIVRVQAAHLRGYNHAVASSLRFGPIRGLEDTFSSPAFEQKKVLLIHGTEDNTVPYKHAAKVMKLLKGSKRLITVEGGNHHLTISHPDLIVDSVVAFFSEK